MSNKHTLPFNLLKGRENFAEWKTGARAYLRSRGHWSQVTTMLAPDAKDEVKTANEKALAELTLLIEPNLYSYIEEFEQAKPAWDALVATYEDKGAARKVTLLKQWITLHLESCSSLHDYVNKSVALRNRVKSAGFDINDEIAGSILLCGLTDEYKPVIMSMESKDKLTLDSVKTVLLQNIDESVDENAMNVYHKQANKNNHNKSNNQNKKNNNQKSKKNGKVKCYDCGGNHFRNKCSKSKGNENGECVMYSAFAAEKVNEEWYIDSGATKHMTHVNMMMDNKRNPLVPEVRVANNEKLKIEYVGDVKCNMDGNSEMVTLKDVQYVPELCVNLLSVSALVKNGNTAVFDINGCKIYNKKKEIIATGNLVGDMFKLNVKMNENVCAVEVRKIDDEPILWHRRLAHANFNTLKSALNIKVQSDLKCIVCAKGKQARSPFSDTGTRATKTLEIIHSDVCGKLPVRSLGGSNYFVTFIDDFSRKVFVYPIRAKSEVLSRFIEFKTLVENETENKIKILRSDGGGEYKSKKFAKFCADNGIKHETTTPYTPQQNGVAERNNRTILEKARCMLIDANLSKQFWAEAVCAAVDIINVLPNAPNKQAPNERWNGKKCNLKHFKVFGCKAMAWLPNCKRDKLDAKSVECVYLRSAENQKAFRLYDTQSNKIIVSRDVIFMENENKVINPNAENRKLYRYIESEDDDFDKFIVDAENDSAANESISMADEPADIAPGENDSDTDVSVTIAPGENDYDADESIVTVRDNSEHDSNESTDTVQDDNEEPNLSSVSTFNKSEVESSSEYDTDTGTDYVTTDNEANDPTYTTRAKINVDPPRRKTRSDMNLLNFHVAFIANEPSSYKQALEDENREKWMCAMKEEYESLIKNNTWELVERPVNQKIVDNKWVYRVKEKTKNSPMRFKARLCARGFTQQHGVNYFETFSPVVRFTSIRIILAIAAQRRMCIKQFDIKTAFLNGELKEEVYMEQPIGFSDGTNKVCRLKASLYGLKQASRCWNEKFSKFIKLFGFRQCKADPCVYVSRKNGALTMLAIHVDDGLIAGENQSDVKSVIKYLGEHFEIKEMDIGCFLGLEIEQKPDGSIFVHQSTYAAKVLSRFNMENCVGVSTPIDANQMMHNFDESEPSSYPYRELIGSVMYLAVGTRADIAHAVAVASRHMEKPTIVHERAAKRILKYLKKTLNFGILYLNSNTDELIAYSDADYAGDIETRRSTSGAAFMYGGGIISWCSERQKSVSLSTTESEYIAASQCVKELIWLKQIFCELLENNSLKIKLLMDNQSAIRLIKNPEFHKRTKHIDVRYHFIREKYEENLFMLHYIPTNEMLADTFTKALASPKFVELVKKLGMTSA